MISTAIPFAQIRHIPQRETEQHVQSRKAVEHKNYETNSSYHCSLWFEILNLVGPKYTDYHHSPTTINGSILFLCYLLTTKNFPHTIFIFLTKIMFTHAWQKSPTTSFSENIWQWLKSETKPTWPLHKVKHHPQNVHTELQPLVVIYIII